MSESTDGNGARILIVDDQESNVRLLEHALRRGGYAAVSSTTDPLAVCELQRQNRYDLILLDLQMPRRNGFEVIEELLAVEGDRAAILVLSADPAQEPQALKAGAAGFLSKPFLLAEVLRRVRLIVEKNASAAVLPDGVPRVERAPAALARPL